MFLSTTEFDLLVNNPNSVHLASVSDDGRYLAYLTPSGQTAAVSIELKDLTTGSITKIAMPEASGTPDNLHLTPDGSKLAFSFVNASTGIAQIYVKDLLTGALQLASSNAAGVAANSASTWSANGLSSNGRYLSFSSKASNLVSDDKNAASDVFVKDLQTGAITLASKDPAGALGDHDSSEGQISQDGRYVLFKSEAQNLAAPNDNNINLFVKDLQTGALQYANQSETGEVFNKNPLASEALLSANGKKVAFTATSLQAFVKDLQSGVLSLVASDASGKPMAGESEVASISADGRYVSFSLSVNDGNGSSTVDIYQKDLQTGALQLLSPHSERFASSQSYVIGASANGQHVLAIATHPNSFAADANGNWVQVDGNKLVLINSTSTSTTSNNLGNDRVIGTTGADKLAGGAGNDKYWLDHAGDQVSESANGGDDTVFSFVADYSLPENVENLVLDWHSDLGLATLSSQQGTGNALNNRLLGNDLDNVLRGMAGNDFFSTGAGSDQIDGGTGFDHVSYTGLASEYQLTKLNGAVQLTAVAGNKTDTLQNIERVYFSDLAYSYTGDTIGSQAYSIYQAAFNRTPDAGGLGYWIKQIENGAKLDDVANGFMQSGEFLAMYGAHPSNGAMVEKFYQNVLHRAPDAGGLNFWTDVLNQHNATAAQVLASFAASPENQAALVGVFDNGFSFTPFVG